MADKKKAALDWVDLRIRSISHIHEHPLLPDAVKKPAKQLTGHAINIASQITGNLELAWRRGYHTGYVEGFKDAKAGKKSRF